MYAPLRFLLLCVLCGGFFLGGCIGALAAFLNGVGHGGGDEADGADGVIVGGDDIVDLIGVAVGIDDGADAAVEEAAPAEAAEE